MFVLFPHGCFPPSSSIPLLLHGSSIAS
jgi:hypothetical protein